MASKYILYICTRRRLCLKEARSLLQGDGGSLTTSHSTMCFDVDVSSYPVVREFLRWGIEGDGGLDARECVDDSFGFDDFVQRYHCRIRAYQHKFCYHLRRVSLCRDLLIC